MTGTFRTYRPAPPAAAVVSHPVGHRAGRTRVITPAHPLTEAELAERHPEVARAGRYFAPEQFDRTFELGLEVLLTGLGVTARP